MKPLTPEHEARYQAAESEGGMRRVACPDCGAITEREAEKKCKPQRDYSGE